MNNNNKSYGQDSISSLKGEERVRKRPEVIFGSKDLAGCTHSVFEIISNSVDEAKEGFGDRIDVVYDLDGTITVEDRGRGIPLDWNEREGKYNWELVFCELYAGGKYGKDDSYGASLGLNGLGACATQYASEFMDVVVHRDKTSYKLHFEKGKIVGNLIKESTEYEYTGTKIRFKPDLEVFEDIKISYDTIADMLRRQAMLHKGLQFVLKYDTGKEELLDENKATAEYIYDEFEYEEKERLEETEKYENETDTPEKDESDLDESEKDELESDEIIDYEIENKVIDVKNSYKMNGTWREITFVYTEGIKGYLKSYLKDKPLCAVHEYTSVDTGKDREDKGEYEVTMNYAVTFSKTANLLEMYHNSSWLEYGGVPEISLKKAIVKAFDTILKDTGKYNKNDTKVTYKDIESIMICIISTFCLGSITSYENQTKKAINNKFIGEALERFIFDSTLRLLRENKESVAVIDAVLFNKRVRESEDKFRQGAIKKLTASIDGATTRPEKFLDCASKDHNLREIYVVEGDSALGACKHARNGKFQAIFPVRGKVTNVLKGDTVKILSSEIITDLCRVIGCGVELHSKNLKGVVDFDLKKLTWDKIIICTDADIDGFHIRTLLIAFFYRFMPTLIKMGKVYIAESPLYEIVAGKIIKFAYTDEEKNKVVEELEKNGAKNIKVNRSKGLGENDPEMMSVSTMHPDTRKLIRLVYKEEEALKIGKVFDSLLGNNIDGRKELISIYAADQHEKVYTM